MNLSEIEISVDRLLDTVKRNRTTHQDNYNTLVEDRKQAIKDYVESLSDEKLIHKCTTFEQLRSFPEPEDHTADYDFAIQMLEMEERKTIQLDSGQFKSLVMDQWAWSNNLLRTASAYGKADLFSRG